MQALCRSKIVGVFSVAVIGLSLVTPSVAQAPPVPLAPAAPRTLWSFLGIPQGARKIHGALFNRRGNRPGWEKRTPLKALNDPRNLFSENMPIKAAAEIKMEEDLKPQKIKAIKYLTSIGCGCYDQDKKITKALVAAMQDCTEEVRLTTIEKITEAAEGECCSHCGKTCCCNQDLVLAMAKTAYGRDEETGCHIEPSQRVREAAAQALEVCCPDTGPVIEYVEDEMIENPEPEPDSKPDVKGDDPEATKDKVEAVTEDDVEAVPEGSDENSDVEGQDGFKDEAEDAIDDLDEDFDNSNFDDDTLDDEDSVETSVDRAIFDLGNSSQSQTSFTIRDNDSSIEVLRRQVRKGASKPATRMIVDKRVSSSATSAPRENHYWAPTREATNSRGSTQNGLVRVVEPPVQFQRAARLLQRPNRNAAFQSVGKLIHADQRRGLAHVHLTDRATRLSVGDRLTVYRDSRTGNSHVGTVEITQVFNGSANVRAVSRDDLKAIEKGLSVSRDPSQQSVLATRR